MAFPTLRMMDMTGPLGFPADIVLAQVMQQSGGGERLRLGRVLMTRNDELERNLFEFADDALRKFENALQFRMVLTGDDGHLLGDSIIEASDVDSPKERLTLKFFVTGDVAGPFYELGYRVLPG